MNESLRIHQFLPNSRANGPGVRAVVWVQGCSLGCPGCYNPQTHSFDKGKWIPVEALVKQIRKLGNVIEGLTISGGEPFQQPEALFQLLKEIKAQTDLSTLVFSGYSLLEIQSRPMGNKTIAYIDVLIAGRFNQQKRVAHGLLGSSNKKIHLLSDRYSEKEITSVPEAELILTLEGEILISGIDPLQ
jgi:anaerobic ribonucleoside-triphosphate reductase activating protein